MSAKTEHCKSNVKAATLSPKFATRLKNSIQEFCQSNSSASGQPSYNETHQPQQASGAEQPNSFKAKISKSIQDWTTTERLLSWKAKLPPQANSPQTAIKADRAMEAEPSRNPRETFAPDPIFPYGFSPPSMLKITCQDQSGLTRRDQAYGETNEYDLANDENAFQTTFTNNPAYLQPNSSSSRYYQNADYVSERNQNQIMKGFENRFDNQQNMVHPVAEQLWVDKMPRISSGLSSRDVAMVSRDKSTDTTSNSHHYANDGSSLRQPDEKRVKHFLTVPSSPKRDISRNNSGDSLRCSRGHNYAGSSHSLNAPSALLQFANTGNLIDIDTRSDDESQRLRVSKHSLFSAERSIDIASNQMFHSGKDLSRSSQRIQQPEFQHAPNERSFQSLAQEVAAFRPPIAPNDAGQRTKENYSFNREISRTARGENYYSELNAAAEQQTERDERSLKERGARSNHSNALPVFSLQLPSPQPPLTRSVQTLPRQQNMLNRLATASPPSHMKASEEKIYEEIDFCASNMDLNGYPQIPAPRPFYNIQYSQKGEHLPVEMTPFSGIPTAQGVIKPVAFRPLAQGNSLIASPDNRITPEIHKSQSPFQDPRNTRPDRVDFLHASDYQRNQYRQCIAQSESSSRGEMIKHAEALVNESHEFQRKQIDISHQHQHYPSQPHIMHLPLPMSSNATPPHNPRELRKTGSFAKSASPDSRGGSVSDLLDKLSQKKNHSSRHLGNSQNVSPFLPRHPSKSSEREHPQFYLGEPSQQQQVSTLKPLQQTNRNVQRSHQDLMTFHGNGDYDVFPSSTALDQGWNGNQKTSSASSSASNYARSQRQMIAAEQSLMANANSLGGQQVYFASTGSAASRSSWTSSGRHVTPSPSDSGLAELETVLKEKEDELLYLKETMDTKASAIARSYHAKEEKWFEKLQEWGLKLELATKSERKLTLQLQQQAEDRRCLQLLVDDLSSEKQGLQRKIQDLEKQFLELKRNVTGDERPATMGTVCASCKLHATPGVQPGNGSVSSGGWPFGAIESSKAMLHDTATGELRGEVDSLRKEITSLRTTLMDQVSSFTEERSKWHIEKQRVMEYQKLLQQNYLDVFKRNKTLEEEYQHLKRITAPERDNCFSSASIPKDEKLMPAKQITTVHQSSFQPAMPSLSCGVTSLSMPLPAASTIPRISANAPRAPATFSEVVSATTAVSTVSARSPIVSVTTSATLPKPATSVVTVQPHNKTTDERAALSIPLAKSRNEAQIAVQGAPPKLSTSAKAEELIIDCNLSSHGAPVPGALSPEILETIPFADESVAASPEKLMKTE